jgi:hypothetical protein
MKGDNASGRGRPAPQETAPDRREVLMVREDFTNARIVNIVLGVWLFISAFLWPHSYAQMTNTWILGALCVAFALIAMRVPEARYLNTLLAVWLFISVWALPSISSATRWVNALTAIAIFIASLAPGYLSSTTTRSS